MKELLMAYQPAICTILLVWLCSAAAHRSMRAMNTILSEMKDREVYTDSQSHQLNLRYKSAKQAFAASMLVGILLSLFGPYIL